MCKQFFKGIFRVYIGCILGVFRLKFHKIQQKNANITIYPIPKKSAKKPILAL